MTRRHGPPPNPLHDAPEHLRVVDFWARAKTRHQAKPGDCAGYFAYAVKISFTKDRIDRLIEMGYSREEAHHYAIQGVPTIREIAASAGVSLSEPLLIETVPPAPEERSFRPPRDPEFWPAP